MFVSFVLNENRNDKLQVSKVDVGQPLDKQYCNIFLIIKILNLNKLKTILVR